MITLPKLPFDYDALSPHISEETMRLHHLKHHQAYVDNTNRLIEKTEYKGMALEEIIEASFPEDIDEMTDEDFEHHMRIFDNAAQIWNHDFFWKSLTPNHKPLSGLFLDKVNTKFGSQEQFFEEFKMMSKDLFGSGWVWLMAKTDGSLDIVNTMNAFSAFLFQDAVPLICCDVWEHAYYLDYQNRRVDFVDAFLNKLVNWEFAESRLQLLKKL